MNLFITNNVLRKMCFVLNSCHMVRDTEFPEKVVKDSIIFFLGKIRKITKPAHNEKQFINTHFNRVSDSEKVKE